MDISSVFGTLKTLLLLVISASGLASLIFAVIHMTKGNSDAASKMWMLLIGCAIGVGIISAFDVDKTTGNIGESFDSLKDYVSSILVSALSAVSMVALTLNVIKIMQGNHESLRKFFTWLLVSAFGIGLMSAL